MKIVLPDALGDALCITPLVREIRRRRPQEKILLANVRHPDLWAGNPHLAVGLRDDGSRFEVNHEIECNAGSLPRKYARQLGYWLLDDVPEIFLNEKDRAQDFGLADWSRTIAIDVWSRTQERRWPRWGDVALALAAAGWRVLEVGRHEGPRIQAAASFVNRLSVRQTAVLLERVTLYAGNDSGLMHLAAAVGTPQVAMFGAAVPPARREYWNTVGLEAGGTVGDVLRAVDVAAHRFTSPRSRRS